jgi:predicted tellurium resistance membrane protein TerC
VEMLADPQVWIAFATLTALEIVLGVDNIIFISILVGRLPEAQRERGRIIGLTLAMGTRIALLLSLAWIMKLTAPLFEIMSHPFSGRDFILLGGGLFLLWKSVHEIHNSLEGDAATNSTGTASFTAVMGQIAVIDVVFSLDSVITAVGLVDQVEVMIAAIVTAVAVMMFSAKAIGEFVDAHPTIKMLALSFLILVAVALIGEGFGFHIPKGYIYFAMAFSVGVEMLNLRAHKRKAAIRLRKPAQPGDDDT